MFDRVSILVPVFNNAETLPRLVAQVSEVMDGVAEQVEFVFVEDASADDSRNVLHRLEGPWVKVICNPDNIGQQASIRKGLAACTGQAVVVMDADLQDPPHAIPALLHAMQGEGYDAVFAARVGRYQSGWRMVHSHLFRFLIRRLTNLPPGAGGFVALTAPLAKKLAGNRQTRFYLVGLIGSGGHRLHAIPIKRNMREIGQSAYTGPMRLKLGFANLVVVLTERMARGPR